MRKNSKVWKFIVTFGGLGYSPYAPGTVGALGAMVPALLILQFSEMPNLWLSLMVLGSIILGTIGATKLEFEWGKDSSMIVIDEVAGIWISVLWVRYDVLSIITAFILFRFFDIVKPLGIRYAERANKGIGVMLDDIVAGIYTNLILQFFYIITPRMQ